jgi:hypothetical protein
MELQGERSAARRVCSPDRLLQKRRINGLDLLSAKGQKEVRHLNLV